MLSLWAEMGAVDMCVYCTVHIAYLGAIEIMKLGIFFQGFYDGETKIYSNENFPECGNPITSG